MGVYAFHEFAQGLNRGVTIEARRLVRNLVTHGGGRPKPGGFSYLRHETVEDGHAINLRVGAVFRLVNLALLDDGLNPAGVLNDCRVRKQMRQYAIPAGTPNIPAHFLRMHGHDPGGVMAPLDSPGRKRPEEHYQVIIRQTTMDMGICKHGGQEAAAELNNYVG